MTMIHKQKPYMYKFGEHGYHRSGHGIFTRKWRSKWWQMIAHNQSVLSDNLSYGDAF